MNYLKQIKLNLFLYIKQVIENKRKNFFIEFFLFLFSFFYSAIVFVKNFMYDSKILKSKKVNSKVISIGNIECGGTGKTPFTIFLANKIIKDKKLAIVTRGYKSKYENKFLYIKKEDNFDFSEMGDESVLYKNHIKNISIFIGKNKVYSAKKASDLNYDVILMDDAFQYRKLKKDLEILLINANGNFLKNRCLPYGLLREPIKSLKRAHLLVINNSDGKNDQLEKEIKKYSNCPIFYSKPQPKRFLDFSKNIVNLEKNTNVAVFCGIANPINFFKTIEKMGLNIVNKLELSDHEGISKKKLDNFIEESLIKKAEYIITTEKDFVKLNFTKNKIPIVYLEIILNIIPTENNEKTLVEKIYNLFNN